MSSKKNTADKISSFTKMATMSGNENRRGQPKKSTTMEHIFG